MTTGPFAPLPPDLRDALRTRSFEERLPSTELGRAYAALQTAHPEVARREAATPAVSAKAVDLLVQVADGKIRLQQERYGSPFRSVCIDREAVMRLTKVAFAHANVAAAGTGAALAAQMRAAVQLRDPLLERTARSFGLWATLDLSGIHHEAIAAAIEAAIERQPGKSA